MRRTIYIITLSLLPLLLLIQVINYCRAGGEFEAYAGSQRQRNSSYAGRISVNSLSSPEAGVRLLEDILSRVRNVPQLAMARQNLKYQADQSLSAAAQGPTDYRLAIRPQQHVIKSPAAGVASSGTPLVAGYARPGGSSSCAEEKAAGSKGLWESDSIKGSKFSAAMPSPAPAAVVDQLGQEPAVPGQSKRFSNSKGIWERNEIKKEDIVATRSSAGKITLQAEQGKKKEAAGVHRYLALRPGTLVGKQVPQKSRQYKAAAGLESAGGTVIKDLRPGALETTSKTQRPARLALLPPNVVLGIALVHLGESQSAALSALSQMQAAGRQKVNGWTVLSFRKPGSKGTMLQVFIQHDQVEALRIFDPQLIGPEFGVNLGSHIFEVKSKFGEPTFILPEPYSGAGQNYVYPISQIAFQFARPAAQSSPRIVSMLIFNVK